MADYIEREAVLAEVDKAFKLFVEHDDALQLYSDVRCAVIYAPAADVAPVVWCKDCVHWYAEEVCLKIYSDGAVSPYAWQTRNPDDFCSYGKRREEDG